MLLLEKRRKAYRMLCKKRTGRTISLVSIGIFMIIGFIAAIVFFYPRDSEILQLWKAIRLDLQQNGTREVETPSFSLKLEEPFLYRRGMGFFYREIPDCFQVRLLQINNIFENGQLQSEMLENELCNSLTRGYCEESLSPIRLSEQENREGVQAVYGVFSQAAYAMSDFGELFGLDGEEKNFGELVAHTIEYDHVVLFYVPDGKTQYLFLANAFLISKEEVLKLAQQIFFKEGSFSADAAKKYWKNQEEQEKDLEGEAKRIAHGIEERRRFFRNFKKNGDNAKGVLEITLPKKEENLIPNGLFALQEARKRYVLCLPDGWPIGYLYLPSGRIEWWLEEKSIEASIN